MTHAHQHAARRRGIRIAARVTAALTAMCLVMLAALHALFPFPLARLERWPASPCVTDRTGRVLLTRVSTDDQWRHPVPLTEMSPWLIDATIAVEDERFYTHCGVDPISAVRALGQNLAAGRVVSGASTLTMQICRMLDDRPRTFSAKLVESLRAVQLERRYGKRQILETYLNMAPYGGNLRGVESAAQAYFNKSAARLSLGEAALLAGLPQSPSRYRPDRHLDLALARQRVVLQRMCILRMITAPQLDQASAEPIVISTMRRAMAAPHAAELALARRPAGGRTTIDADLQATTEDFAQKHAQTLPADTQLAVVVIDIAAGEVRALVGSLAFDQPVDGQVNGATARRSPGSALKPFIYATAFDARRLSPESIVWDGPIDHAGWQPRNFDGEFAGAVSVTDALRSSLNVPAILVTESIGLSRCAGVISAAGIDLPDAAVESAGLSLVVGGADVSLLDLTNAYATLGRGGVRSPARLFADEERESVRVLGADTCAAIDEILSSRNRTPAGWASSTSPGRLWFMWKTGTSSRRRDAWAVGHNRRVAIGVWVGRFAGAGSPQFVGALAAEPLLARLFEQPALRAVADPVPPHPWSVVAPLTFDNAARDPLRILYPADDTVLLAPGAAVELCARANRDGLAWFLDGQLVPSLDIRSAAVASGDHRLRCVGEDGASDSVVFRVRSLTSTAPSRILNPRPASGRP